MYALRVAQGDAWREALDLVEATQLAAPDSHANMATQITTTDSSDVRDSDCGSESARRRSGDRHTPPDDTDNVSIIGSDDADEHEDEGSGSESGDSEDLDMLLNFERMMFNEGNLRDPVVNVWYDLDMVTEILDPVHFLEDLKRLRM